MSNTMINLIGIIALMVPTTIMALVFIFAYGISQGWGV